MSFTFLFARFSHWFSSGAIPEAVPSVSKGDEEDRTVTPERLEELIKECGSRANKYRFAYLTVMCFAAAMNPASNVIVELENRFIASGIGIFLILASNLLSWPEYAEKMHTLADRLQDIKDCLDADEILSLQDQIRLRRLLAMLGSPLLYSDKKHKLVRAKTGLLV